MSQLDDKLRVIVNRLGWLTETDDIDQVITDLKQVFAQAGYKTIDTSTKSIYAPTIENEHRTFMTGQEWYERFEKQYHMSADWIAGDPEMGDEAEHDVLSAAKRAAGLEQ